MDDLKPCPLCGKMPIIKRDYGYEGSGFGAWCVIQCAHPFKARMRVTQGKATWERAYEYAVKEWNRKVEDEKYYLTTND